MENDDRTLHVAILDRSIRPAQYVRARTPALQCILLDDYRMTPAELRSILKALGLPPHSKRTEVALGIGRRQIAYNLSGAKPVSRRTIRVLELLLNATEKE